MSKLTRLFIDAANENVEALPRRLADLGVRYPKEREEEFLAELREMYYRYYGASLAEIDPLQVIREAFELIYSMNLQLPTRFVLLDKAIATLGSVGVELYPDFNVFEVARPYARSLMLRALHAPARAGARAQRGAAARRRSRASCRTRSTTSLEQIRDGQIEVGFVHKGLDEFMHEARRRRSTGSSIALVVVGGLIGSSLIGIFATAGPHVLGVHVLSPRRLRPVRRARAVAALGRRPLRTAVATLYRSSRFRAKDIWRARRRQAYLRLDADRAPPRRARAGPPVVPRAAPAPTASRCSAAAAARSSSSRSGRGPTSSSSTRSTRRARALRACARRARAPGTATCR